MFGYKRAAAAILALDVPLTDLVGPDGACRGSPALGPARHASSARFWRPASRRPSKHAIERSDRRADIERRRQLRRHFLSRAEVRRVLSDPAFPGPTLQQYRGDLQMHSEWSDGSPTVQEIADACLQRGYQYAAVTDHSYGLKIAGGMSMAEAAQQRRAIDDVNARLRQSIQAVAGHRSEHRRRRPAGSHRRRGGHLRRGAGRAAFAAAKERGSDRPHAGRNRAPGGPDPGPPARPDHRIARRGDRQLGRGVCIGGQRGVAIEIDGDPARQDLDHTLASRALEAGCRLRARQRCAHHDAALVCGDTHWRMRALPVFPPTES